MTHQPKARASLFRRAIIGPALPAALAVLCMATTLPNPLLRDDVPMIVQNPRIRDWGDGRAIWLTDWWATQTATVGRPADAGRDRLYRPLVMASFAAQYAIHGTWPAGFRSVNLLAHVLCAVLVWLLARRVCNDPAVAAFGAAVFAVHPVHVEAVAEVVGRADIFAAVFLLLGLIALGTRAGLPSMARVFAASGAFLAALLSKESGASYLPLAAIVLIAASRRLRPSVDSLRSLGIRCCVLTLPLACYIPLRYIATGGLLAHAAYSPVSNPLMNAGLSGRLLGALSILGHYTRLFVFPARLSGDYGLAVIDPGTGADAMTCVGVAAIGVLTAPLIWIALRRRATAPAGARRTQPLAPPVMSVNALLAACSFAFMATYFPVSNALILIGAAAGERLFYAPSIPLAIALAVGAAALARRCAPTGRAANPERRVCGALAVAAVMLAGGRSAWRGTDWRSGERLYSADLAAYPNSVKTAVGLGRELLLAANGAPSPEARNAQLEHAEELLNRATQIAPSYARGVALLAVAAEMRGWTDRATELYERANQLDPDDPVPSRRLAALRSSSPRSQAQAAELESRLAADPNDVAAHLALGEREMSAGDARGALPHYEAAMRLEPENADAMLGCGTALLVLGNTTRARDVLLAALDRREDDYRIHGNLAAIFADTDPTRALTHARRAAELRPEDIDVQLNLVEALVKCRDTTAAVALLENLAGKLPAGDARRSRVDVRLAQLRRGSP